MAVKIKKRIRFSTEALSDSDKGYSPEAKKEVQAEVDKSQSRIIRTILSDWLRVQVGKDDNISTKGDIEKLIIRQLVNTYASKLAKDLDKFAMATDLVDIIKNSESEIIIDDDDMAAIKAGFEESLKANRPDGWIDFPELFRQLRNPETIEV